MRLFFTATPRLTKRAYDNREDGSAQMKNWWSKKYNLPPNHELFTSQSFAELQIEMYEDMLQRREGLIEQLDEAKSKEYDEYMRQINAIHKVMGWDDYVDDPLIDEWEKDLEAGRMPDLEKGL